jgi:tRNA (uracil-5-)-methyltransferase TRM9
LYFLDNFLFALVKSSGVLILALVNSFIVVSREFMDRDYAKYLLEKNRRDYDLIAEDFSKTRWRIWPEFGIFKRYVKDGDSILDVGCGNGRLLELFKDRKIDYLGVDISQKLIEIAKRKHPQEDFLVADNLNLPFPDNNFDKVFSVAVLHTIPSKELRRKALVELKRVLKPKGLLILIAWNMWRKEMFPLILKHCFLKLIGKSKLDLRDVFISWADKTERYYHVFTQAELRVLTEESGFKIVKRGTVKNERGRRSNLYLIAEK